MEKKSPIMLAPLAEYSDVGFRTVCSDCGADLTFTEMISAQAMKYGNKKTEDMTVRHPDEKQVFAQIFGKDPFVMAQAVKNPLLKKFDGIDINMGCPAHKIIKNGEGSALLKDLPLAGKIVSECVKSSGGKPVSVKVRLGYEKENILEIMKMCEEAGASFVTVHGRIAAQGFSGGVDYDLIAKAKTSSKLKVIGNGDIVDGETYQKMLQTGVDGVMIGRGAIGSPWIFSTLKNSPSPDKFALIRRHVEILRQYYPEKWLVLYLRKHFLAYASALKAKADTKKIFALQQNVDDSLKVLQELSKSF